MEKTYQGWTSRETWAAKLHMDNDYGMYQDFQKAARKLTPRDLEDYIKEVFDEIHEAVLAGQATREARSMILDIGSLYRVNWNEIALSLKEDNAGEEDE